MKPFVAALFMSGAPMARWDNAFKGAGVNLSANGRTATFTGGPWVSTRATRGRSTGKHYFEVTLGGGALGNWMVGVSRAGEAAGNPLYAMTNAGGWRYDGRIYVGTGHAFTWPAFGSGDTMCVAMNVPARLIWIRIGAGGYWNNDPTADPTAGVGGLDLSALAAGTYYPTVSGANAVPTFLLNTGHAPFVGVRPDDFYIWG